MFTAALNAINIPNAKCSLLLKRFDDMLSAPINAMTRKGEVTPRGCEG